MGVLYHLSLRTTAALAQQKETLMEPGLFELGAQGNVLQEEEEVFGPDSEVYAEVAGSLAKEGEGGNGSDRSKELNK